MREHPLEAVDGILLEKRQLKGIYLYVLLIVILRFFLLYIQLTELFLMASIVKRNVRIISRYCSVIFNTLLYMADDGL
jgi:hypothetical protein